MAVAVAVAAVAVLTAVLLPSVLDLVYVELALGAAVLWPIVSEPRAVSVDANGLTIRRLVRRRADDPLVVDHGGRLPAFRRGAGSASGSCRARATCA